MNTDARSPGSARPAHPASGPIPSLDGIRALAVALVFLAHSGLEQVVPGGLGVTVFFVLSGFLITTLMRIEFAASGRIAFGAFYARRLLRLMPPLVIVLVAAGVLASLSIIDGGFSVGGFLAALLYAGNYHVIANDFRGMPAGLGVVWSLAIEEHYYLLYPPLAALLLRLRSPPAAAAVLVALCAAVLVWRCWLVWQGAPGAYVTMASDTRADAILAGCVLAIWRNPWLEPSPPSKVASDGLLFAACVALLLLSVLERGEAFRLSVRFTLQSVAIAGLIYLAVARAERWPARWLSARPLVYLGTISYTVYLVHHVVLLGLARHWPQWSWLQLTLAGALLTWAVAEPMRRWVDRPCAALRRRLHQRALARTPSPRLRFGPGLPP
jgi:peptidoglycan/LPS O-acetylase OafA/YrhL